MQASKYELVPLEAAEAASCGSKAAACGRLLQIAQASGGLFQAPQGAVLPFGTMNLALKVLFLRKLHDMAGYAAAWSAGLIQLSTSWHVESCITVMACGRFLHT